MDNRETKKHLDDEQLVELYWQRDEQAIEETERKYGKLLFRIAWGILHDESDCEECKNDAYLGTWNAIPPTRPRVFRAFIAQMVRRIAVNRYNGKNAKRRIPSEYTSSLDEIANVICSVETVERAFDETVLNSLINGFLASLDKRERYVFIGRFYMAESPETLAKELDVNVSTVYRELTKLKEKLKKHLERNGVAV